MAGGPKNAWAKAMTNQSQNKIVFVGTHGFTFELPSTAEVEEKNYETIDVPGFEAVCTFRHLEEWQAVDEPAFTHAQAVCVTEIEDWDFRGLDNASVLVLPEAVRWVLCFPVRGRDWETRGREGNYIPETITISPDDDDVFFFFTGSTSNGTPIRAVPDLNSLSFLTPCPGTKLALVRAKNWEWDEERNTVLIQPQDVFELEIVLDFGVRVLQRAP